MRLVTWNCNGALRNKAHLLDELNADLFIVQECEDPARFNGAATRWFDSYLWHGEDANKGIGVFSRSNLPLRRIDLDSRNTELMLPFAFGEDRTGLAVWTKAGDKTHGSYIGQLWHYIQKNLSFVSNASLVCGDFNSNAQWDRKRRVGNHSDVVDALEGMGLSSIYHRVFNEPHVSESVPTFFMYRKDNKTYHIDYVFMSHRFADVDGASIELPAGSQWRAASDHIPIVVDC